MNVGLNWTHAYEGISSLGRASFSPCMTYRYGLIREWDSTRGRVLFVLLNPSTADHVVTDPTVERCINRAREWGFGGAAVANLFALRSTDPAVLKSHTDPVGPENDRWIAALALSASRVVCGWGEHGKLNSRSAAVLSMLRGIGASLGYLKLNRSGEPAHPLYLPYSLPWTRWASPD